jgi:hypothetical protein
MIRPLAILVAVVVVGLTVGLLFGQTAGAIAGLAAAAVVVVAFRAGRAVEGRPSSPSKDGRASG